VALAKNVTLRDIRSKLSNRESYVAAAFGVVHRAAREHGDIVMRLGVTGTGQAPNYRIETNSGEVLFAIDGSNHERWAAGERFDGADTWSQSVMTRTEVEELLGELRNFRRKS